MYAATATTFLMKIHHYKSVFSVSTDTESKQNNSKSPLKWQLFLLKSTEKLQVPCWSHGYLLLNNFLNYKFACNWIVNYLVNNRYLHVRHRVAVAAYVRLDNQSQAKISQQRIFATNSVFSAQPHLHRSHGLPPRVLTRLSPGGIFQVTSSLAGMVGRFLATATPCLTWRYRLLTR